MKTVELMAANHTPQKVTSHAKGGFAYDFSKVAPQLPKFVASPRPVSLTPSKSAGGMDLFRMKSSPPTVQDAPAVAESAVLQGGPVRVGLPVRLRSAARLAQSEMRLDAVKVVRNDLSETDFEIIAPRLAPEDAPSGGRTRRDSAGMAGWLARMVGAVRARI